MLRWQFGPPSSWGYNILLRLVSHMRRQCATPENIHSSPTEGSFSKTSPHPSGNSNKTSHNFFRFLGLKGPPTPQEIPITSVRGVWIFYGIVLQNWTLYSDQLYWNGSYQLIRTTQTTLFRAMKTNKNCQQCSQWSNVKSRNGHKEEPFVSLMTSRLLKIMLALFQAF